MEDRGVHWTWRGGELGTERNLKMVKGLVLSLDKSSIVLASTSSRLLLQCKLLI